MVPRVALVGLLSVLAACSLVPREVDVYGADQRGLSENELRLDVNACNADLTADVDETPDEILIDVKARNADANDCGGSLVVELDGPLQGRSVVDRYDDQELFVEGRSGDRRGTSGGSRRTPNSTHMYAATPGLASQPPCAYCRVDASSFRAGHHNGCRIGHPEIAVERVEPQQPSARADARRDG